MELKVKGHSGCSIDVVREGNALFVYKGTTDPKYVGRLVKQAQKQQQASTMEYQHIRVPEILAVEQSEQSATIKMEYIYSKNFVEYFENAGFEQINYLVKALIYFIEKEVAASEMTTVLSTVLTDKFADVKQKTLLNNALRSHEDIPDLLACAERIFNDVGDIRLPVGRCHGDLTFSNILFNGNNYFLIDFLDSFIESPMLDIVKLRQDSAYRWSQLMYVKQFDPVRLRIISEKIDAELDNYFNSRYDWYRATYRPLQLMNFLRILQYANEPHVIAYLKHTIQTLL